MSSVDWATFPHAFEPNLGAFQGPREETCCQHCGTDPQNAVHEAREINASIFSLRFNMRAFSDAYTVPPLVVPDLVGEAQQALGEHDEAMKRAQEARALYGKPSKVCRFRVDNGDFVRVSGDALCDRCDIPYSDHDPVIGFPWLRHACDGRLLKP